MKLSLVAKAAILSCLLMFGFWISLWVTRGVPLGAVLIACVISTLVTIPVYFYGIWLVHKIENDKSKRERDSR